MAPLTCGRLAAAGRGPQWRTKLPRGDGEDWGCDFATQDALSAPPSGLAEKLEVAAAHQVQPASDQPNCAVAEVMCLPGSTGWHAPFAEQPLRNRAVGFAGEVCIERTEDKHQSAPSRRREIIGGAINRLRRDRLPQAKRSISAGGKVLIERDDGRSGRSGRDAADEYNGSAILKNQILSIACGALEYWLELGDAARFTESLWRGREKNGRRSKMWQPNPRGAVCTLVWVEREIATPSG
jgi:hypothetical protein